MKTRKIISFILAAFLIMSAFINVNVADVYAENQIDDTPLEVEIDVDDVIEEIGWNENISAQDISSEDYETTYSLTDYKKYSNTYCYSKLSKAEKILYDRIDAKAKTYLETDIDAVDLTSFGKSFKYFMEVDVADLIDYGNSYDTVQYTRLTNVAYIFINQNPQYFFLDAYVLKSQVQGKLWIRIYDDFKDGKVRHEAAEKFYNKVDEMVMSALLSYSSDYDRIKACHDLVCDAITYGEVKTAGDDTRKGQNAYYGLMDGYCVCAGYARLMEMLCNAAGYETVTITGDNHAWNYVRIGDTFYLVDTTWDDSVTGRYTYSYFLKSYESKKTGHTPFDYYGECVPSAPKDYDPNQIVPEYPELNAYAFDPGDGITRIYVLENLSAISDKVDVSKVSSIKFGIYYEGVSDLKWYAAANDGTGRYLAFMSISDFGKNGQYFGDCYAVMDDHSEIKLASFKYNVSGYKLTTVTIKNVNKFAGTFDIEVTNVSDRAIQVVVPAFTRADLTDLYYYYPEKTRDSKGNTVYIAHASVKNHLYTYGVYGIQAYVRNAGDIDGTLMAANCFLIDAENMNYGVITGSNGIGLLYVNNLPAGYEAVKVKFDIWQGGLEDLHAIYVDKANETDYLGFFSTDYTGREGYYYYIPTVIQADGTEIQLGIGSFYLKK